MTLNPQPEVSNSDILGRITTVSKQLSEISVQVAVLCERYEKLETEFIKDHKILRGNGSPGLPEKMRNMERVITMLTRATWIIISAGLIEVVNWVFVRFQWSIK